MKRFAMALALVCALSGTVLAGDIPSTDKTGQQSANPILTVILAVINVVAG